MDTRRKSLKLYNLRYAIIVDLLGDFFYRFNTHPGNVIEQQCPPNIYKSENETAKCNGYFINLNVSRIFSVRTLKAKYLHNINIWIRKSIKYNLKKCLNYYFFYKNVLENEVFTF